MMHKFVPISNRQHSNKGAKPSTIVMAMMTLMLGGGILVGCNQTTPSTINENSLEDSAITSTADTNTVAATAELFSGCYSVDDDEVPQIKISQQAEQIVMQTRETDPAKGVWNTPEPMQILPLNQVTQYFSEDAQNINGLIARPDKIFAVAHVKSAYVNINPLLDSEYLGFIFKGDNTIFKVACDAETGS